MLFLIDHFLSKLITFRSHYNSFKSLPLPGKCLFMNIFIYLTPITYWILIILWVFILGFYLKRLRSKDVQGRLISILLIILAIDAFRTLFESFYFGAWYTALAGFLPKSVHTFLIRPEMVFIPKIFNVVAAILVIALVIFKWLPREESEKIAIKKLIDEKTKELKKSEQKYQDLYDNAPDMYVSVDAKTSLVIECNQTLAKKLGYTKNEIIGSPIFEMYHPDCLDRAKKEFQKFVSTGLVRDAQLALKTKDGNKVDVNLNATAVRDKQGNILCSRSAWRDITEHKKVEETKNKILESSIGGIYIYNLELGSNTYINRQYTVLTGYTLIELSSMSGPEFATLFHPDDQQGVFEHMRALEEDLPDSSSLQIDYRFKHASGEWRWFRSCDAVYGRDEGGKVLQFIGTFIDITDTKKLENEVIQSHKMEAIGTLAGGIAHDFNNILTSIIGFTELALDDAEKQTMMEDNLQEVYIAAKRAKELVAQILAFARQSEEKLKPVQVDLIVKEVLQFIRSSIPVTIEIESDIESESLVIASQTEVHQVLMNLCTNAAHAMESHGGTLRVSLKDIDPKQLSSKISDLSSDSYLELKVSDTGVGIPSHIIDSIFEPYFTTKGPGEGTGMGLAMIQGIIESYHGKIVVESSHNQGSTFIVYLPITKKIKPAPLYSSEPLPTGTESILLVDDEIAITKMGKRTLELMGYTVETRSNSIETLDLFSNNPDKFDVVITDMTMPNTTGDILASELIKIRPDIPVILCTGYSKNISDESVAEIGIKAIAYKPIVKADLAKTVRKVLDDAQKEG